MKARLPKGVGGGPQNMQTVIRQAQKMQQDMTAKQEELAQREFTAAAGGGAVSITMTGNRQVTALTIQPEVVDPEDIEMLQDLVISAVNECLHTIEDTTNQELDAITNGMNIPGIG